MKFTARLSDFMTMTGYAVGTTSKKSTLQILSHVLIEAYEDKVILMASDTEQTFRGTISATVEKPGRVTVPAGVLTSILPSLSSEEVVIESDTRSHVTVTTADKRKRNFTLYGTNAEGFPLVPDFEEGKMFSLSQSVLAEAIDHTNFCTSTDPLRSWLQGALFEETDSGRLRVVASDSRRLAIYEVPESAPSPGLSAIIPARALAEVQKVLTGGGNIELSITDRRVYFRLPNVEISVGLIEGRFPNYQTVLVTDCSTQVEVDREEFYDAVDSVSRLLDKDSPQLRLHVAESGVELASHQSPRGEGEAAVDAKEFEGKELTLGMNHRYLKDALQHIAEGTVRMMLNGPTAAAKIVPVTENEHYFFIVMPMRLEEPTTAGA